MATKPCANLLSDEHSVSFRKQPSTSATPRISSVTTWMSLSSTSLHWSVQTTPPTCTLVMAETHVLFRNPWAIVLDRQTLGVRQVFTDKVPSTMVWIPPVPSGDPTCTLRVWIPPVPSGDPTCTLRGSHLYPQGVDPTCTLRGSHLYPQGI